MVAHSVPLWGCERIPMLGIICIAVVPIASTGVVHLQIDFFSILVFFPLWGGARLLYLYDPRSAAKLADHLSWVFERYLPRRPLGDVSADSQSKKAGRSSKFISMLTRSLRS